jgi:hypothetical protein
MENIKNSLNVSYSFTNEQFKKALGMVNKILWTQKTGEAPVSAPVSASVTKAVDEDYIFDEEGPTEPLPLQMKFQVPGEYVENPSYVKEAANVSTTTIGSSGRLRRMKNKSRHLNLN